jgi:hypothetical protein
MDACCRASVVYQEVLFLLSSRPTLARYPALSSSHSADWPRMSYQYENGQARVIEPYFIGVLAVIAIHLKCDIDIFASHPSRQKQAS